MIGSYHSLTPIALRLVYRALGLLLGANEDEVRPSEFYSIWLNCRIISSVSMLRQVIRSTFRVRALSVRFAANAATIPEDTERVSVAISRLQNLPPDAVNLDPRLELMSAELIELIPRMNDGEATAVLNLLAARKHRNIPALKLIAQKLIESDPNPTPKKLVQLAGCLKILSFYYPPLYEFIAQKFVYRVNEFSKWSQISTMVDAFAGMQINNREFWKFVCSWMDTHVNIESHELNEVQRIISGCALVNVPVEFLQRPIQQINQRLIESVATKRKATEWLNLVHSLAIMNSLTPEATRVFFPGFLTELRRNLPPLRFFRAVTHILQIQSAFRHDLKQEPKFPQEILDFLQGNEQMAETIRYRNNPWLKADLEGFRQTFYLFANINTHATPPHLDLSTGAFVDAMLWIDLERKVALPLTEGPKTPNAQQVAVIYGTPSLQTRKDVGTVKSDGLPPTRPLGELQMNLRHLNARGIRPVFISCYELAQLESTEHKLPYIRDRVLNTGYSEEKWTWAGGGDQAGN